MRHKLVMVMLSVMLVVGLILTGCVPEAAPVEEPTVEEEWEYLIVTGGSPGGVYYPLAGGISVIIEKMTDYRCAAMSTAASVETCRLLHAGKVQLGWSEGGIAMAAMKGEEPFEHPIDVRALFTGYSSVMHHVTIEGSGIESMYDLKGKRIGTGEPGQAVDVAGKIVCEMYGYNYPDDFAKIANLSDHERIKVLIDGLVDFIFTEGAYPYGVIMEVAAARDLVLLPMSDEMIEKQAEIRGFGFRVDIPAGTYPGVDYDVPCFGLPNMVICHEGMPEDVAYTIVKAVFENVDTGKYALTGIHPVAMQMRPENAVKTMIPLHPGAERYFREVGAIK